MSSTNRGTDRKKFDYYVTPIKDVENFLKEFKKNNSDIDEVEKVLDPSAGGGS